MKNGISGIRFPFFFFLSISNFSGHEPFKNLEHEPGFDSQFVITHTSEPVNSCENMQVSEDQFVNFFELQPNDIFEWKSPCVHFFVILSNQGVISLREHKSVRLYRFTTILEPRLLKLCEHKYFCLYQFSSIDLSELISI